jgi:hypothetical protein
MSFSIKVNGTIHNLEGAAALYPHRAAATRDATVAEMDHCSLLAGRTVVSS